MVREDPRNAALLYAGLEQGVWFSLDRGGHWQSLRLNMPPTAVHDMRVQPDRHDLVIATHGRGFWILDDVNALSGLSEAVAGGVPTFFPLPVAYTWYRWWSDYYGTHPDECCLTSGAYAADNPPDGASITYYLPRAAPSSIEIRNAAGRRIRCFDAPDGAGVQRTAWDLTESPPVEWRRAREWNRGSDGPEAVPGRYTVALRASGETISAPLDVRPDPRASWTQAQYVERYEFVKALDDELSSIDVALNRLDSLPYRDPALYAMFTSGVVNSEDDLLRPDRLRERLTILQGVIALSQGPPLPPHQREAASITAQYEAAMSAYRAFLAAHHLAPDPPRGECT